MNPHLASIIIPCYNAEQWIGETIESALQQTYQPTEIVVVDDGSTDSSLLIIQSFGDRVNYVTGPNRGLPAARNRGLELSKGDYILYLDADDRIAKDHIAALVDGLQGNKNHIAVSRWARLEQQEEEWVRTESKQEHPPKRDVISGVLNVFLDPVNAWGVPVHCVLWNRDILLRIGCSDVNLPHSAEIDCFFQAILSGVGVVYVEQGCAYHRFHKQSGSSLSKSGNSEQVRSNKDVVLKLEKRLFELGRLNDYRIQIAQVYYGFATLCANHNLDPSLMDECLFRAKRLAGHKAITGTPIGRFLSMTLGLERKERLARMLAQLGIANPARREYMRWQKAK